MAAKRRREQEATLMTRAMRDRLAVGGKPRKAHTFATVRIRLPEGLLLQVSLWQAAAVDLRQAHVALGSRWCQTWPCHPAAAKRMGAEVRTLQQTLAGLCLQ